MYWTTDSVVVAALGRPLDLGMLYDCRSDSLCSGTVCFSSLKTSKCCGCSYCFAQYHFISLDVSLWDDSTIAFMFQSLPRPLTEVKCIEGDSLQDRFRALDVTTPLRASVLSGLVEVGGAAGYLNHPVQSTLQDRVTLQYRTTTRLDMLSHRVLQEETVRTQRKATHVVMAVLYGAQAFFTFDYKHINGQHSGAGEADMHSVVKKMIPTFSADQIFSSLSDDEKPNSLLYQCTLYSDVDHVNGSMTYDRALQVYETFPKHLGQQGEKAVPLYAWLYPLKNLDNSVKMLFFTKAEGVLDHLRQATMRCQEMMTDFTNGCVMKWFPDLKYKLSRLSELLQKYQSEFKREVAMAVKTMRESEGVDENRLRDILQNHDQSPFCLQSIQLWLNNKAAEVRALNVCKTRNIPMMKSQEELDGVLRSSKDRLLCFTLTSLEDEDPFLSTMEQHKHSVPMNTVNQSDLTGQQHKHSVPMNTVNQSDLTGQQHKHSVPMNTVNQSDLTGQQHKHSVPMNTMNQSDLTGQQHKHSVPMNTVNQSDLTGQQHKHSVPMNTVNQSDLTGQQHKHSVPMNTVNQSDLTGQQHKHSVPMNTVNQSDLTGQQHKHSVQENTVNQSDLTGQQHKHSVPMNTVNQSDLTGQQHKHSVPMNTVNQSDLTGQQETQRPFKPPDLTQKIQSALRLFTKSYEDSGDGENIKFIAAVIHDISIPGSSIRLYQQGSIITTNFQLGLKPDPFQVAEIKQSCVLLTFPQSTIRRPERYIVEYRVMTTGVSKVSKRPWNVVDTLAPAETCLVPGLKPFTLYHIRYSVIEHSGMSDFSKVIEVKTLRSPPEQLYVSRLLNKTKETVKVTWFQPECEDGASVLHYKVDYKETGLEGWSTMVTEGPECYCDVTLNLSTCYRVRVSAVYGEGDTSETSRETDVPVNVWSIDLSERKASLLLEVLKLQPEKKPVELKGWSDEESEVRSFLQCLHYISQLSCGDDRFFQTVCESIPVRSREEDQQLASLLQALGSTLSLGGVLPRKTCRSVGRVLGLCASRVDLTLTPSKISLQGAALLLRHESKLHKLRLNVGVAVKLSRLVRRTGRGATPLTVPELSLDLKSSQPPERVLSRALSSVASLLRLWRVQCLDLTDFCIQGHSLITLLCHQGPLSLRLNSDTLQQLTVVAGQGLVLAGQGLDSVVPGEGWWRSDLLQAGLGSASLSAAAFNPQHHCGPQEEPAPREEQLRSSPLSGKGYSQEVGELFL
ncbi:uncharacterized protein LOC121843502 [Oncorhynchus tshawytscha]|uniref:uncharacterized protein LOC121843502 n=1 Tax=Oncorhynchus tshawytscha TaxID=74940 RepID=UPI001C3D036A|nr:uncharacterized protein LOC121843502 [Oncorhynchus tshawytscha]